MVAPWVWDEMATADLKDKRLNDRLREVLSQLAARPTASIPGACGGHAEMTAAYRFFDNEKATWPAILSPHVEATRRRVAEQPVIILANDTTEVDVTRPEQPVEGAGPLDGGPRQGAFLHPLHAFTPDGTPLGTLYAQTWVREDEVVCASLSRAERASIPIEEKESYRWIEMLRRAREEALRCPSTQWVCVADSEADIYELLIEGMVEPRRVDWIVRACQNRALMAEKCRPDAEKYVHEAILAQSVLFTQTIQVRGRKAKVACETRGRRQPRESRETQVEVRAARVTLRPPWRVDRKLPAVTINAVLVREIDPPKDDEPVEWLLLTSLPVDDLQQVRRVIQYYCVRWMIEVFFRVLKSGCRVEERRFEHIDRLLSCLAVYLIVAWRTLFVCRLGRSCPDISCEAVFEPAEWKSVWKVIHRSAPPRVPPPLNQIVRLIAQLGGYVNRKNGDSPGPQTIWIGLQRMHDFALCWQIFSADARAAPELV
jgi:Transposase DNA-binding/Transposase Tn5 dimerisation domain